MNIELTPEQAKDAINLMDFAIRQGGAQAAEHALPLIKIIGAALRTAEEIAPEGGK